MKKLIFLFALLWPFCGNAQIITTVAGNGIPGYVGDGGPATAAKIKYPAFMAFDSHNNFYFPERLNNIIRKVSNTGIISTFAGNDTMGFSGDGGPATLAKLNSPAAVAVDFMNNVYIADEGNNRVRKVDATTGYITTVVGTGTLGFNGDGGPATAALLNYPIGITCDRYGDLYISDHLNNRIRKMDTLGFITTYAGNGNGTYGGDDSLAITAGINAPYGLACDQLGNLYIADGTDRIRKVNATTHIITTIAGNGVNGYNGDNIAATVSELWLPIAVNLDIHGSLYVADQDNNRVRLVDTNGIIHTIAGKGIAGYIGDGGLADSAEIYYPEGVAIDTCGNLYIADEANCRIRKVTFDSTCGSVDTTTGVNNVAEGNEIKIYPNPATAELTITASSPDSYQGNSVQLINLLGQVVLQQKLSTQKTILNISSLPNGIYFIKVNGGYVQKVLKE